MTGNGTTDKKWNNEIRNRKTNLKWNNKQETVTETKSNK